MHLRLMRPGGSFCLVAGLFVGVPFCEAVSWQLWVRNPIGGALIALLIGLVVWLLFVRPAERAVAVGDNRADPLDAVFAHPLVAWGARLSLSLCLVLSLHTAIETLGLFLGMWLDDAAEAALLRDFPIAMGRPGFGQRALVGFWLALAVAASFRGAGRLCASVRFFNLVALFVLVGALLYVGGPLSTMVGNSFTIRVQGFEPIWLYAAVAALAVPAVTIGRVREPGWRRVVLGIGTLAIVCAVGALVPAGYVRRMQLSGIGLTGSIEFMGCFYHTAAHPIAASKGLLLVLASFGWAQVLLLALRNLWSGRLRFPKLTMLALAVLCWNEWPQFGDSSLVSYRPWYVSFIYPSALVCSVFAAVLVGYGLISMRAAPDLRARKRRERTAVAAGVAAAALVGALGLPGVVYAPFLAGVAVMLIPVRRGLVEVERL